MNGERAAGVVVLTSTGARLFVWGYYAATLILALWTIGDAHSPQLVLGTLALYAGACLAMTLDDGERLSLPVAIAAIVVGPASVLMLSWQLEEGGYTAWYIGAATAMLFLVSLRGRIVLAWVGCALFVAALIAWGATTPWVGVAEAVLISTRQSAILVVGTLTAVGLRRTGRRTRRLAQEASVRGAAEAAGRAASNERRRRLADLQRSVVPLLERIASGIPITAADRQEFAAAEADLRDGLRARGLRQSELISAAREARARGVDVVLLDDSDPEALDLADIDRFATIVVHTLRSAIDGRVTARLLPPGRDSMGTVVADGSTYERHDVPRTP